MLKTLLLAPAFSAVAALFFANSPASAAAIRTASFELPVLNPGGIQYSADESATYDLNSSGAVAIPNFTFTGFSGIIINGAQGVFQDTSFGTQAAFLQSYLGTGSAITWAISGLTAGQAYTLSFYDVAANLAVAPGESFTVSAFGSPALVYLPATSYTLQSFNFIAGASSGNINFIGLAVAGNGNFATAIDNIQISTIPEPLTLSLFGVGLVGAGLMRRRRTKKSR